MSARSADSIVYYNSIVCAWHGHGVPEILHVAFKSCVSRHALLYVDIRWLEIWHSYTHRPCQRNGPHDIEVGIVVPWRDTLKYDRCTVTERRLGSCLHILSQPLSLPPPLLTALIKSRRSWPLDLTDRTLMIVGRMSCHLCGFSSHFLFTPSFPLLPFQHRKMRPRIRRRSIHYRTQPSKLDLSGLAIQNSL